LAVCPLLTLFFKFNNDLKLILAPSKKLVAHIYKHRIRLENIVQVGVDFVAPRHDLILVAGYFEAVAAFFQANHSHIR
jgi:hypothetical protein